MWLSTNSTAYTTHLALPRQRNESLSADTRERLLVLGLLLRTFAAQYRTLTGTPLSLTSTASARAASGHNHTHTHHTIWHHGSSSISRLELHQCSSTLPSTRWRCCHYLHWPHPVWHSTRNHQGSHELGKGVQGVTVTHTPLLVRTHGNAEPQSQKTATQTQLLSHIQPSIT